jgi:putative spermidine/putrescine transport system ATP-binding protein
VFVNQFVGTTNLIPGELTGDARGCVRLPGGALLAAAPAPGLPPGTQVVLSVRPEQLRMHAELREGAVPATIKAVLPLGAHVMYEAWTEDGVALKISEPRDAGARMLAPGERVYVAPVAPAACQVFRSDARGVP